MTAKIFKFPSNHAAFTIHLYTDEEIKLAVKAVNIFSNIGRNITRKSLPFVDPLYVINCLNMAKINLDFFSIEEHYLCRKILNSVERICTL